jgi:cation transporter-like permease
MKHIREHLEKLRKVKKREHHPLIHHIHEKYCISKKTLFYVKEYGAHTNVPRTIIRESIGILFLSAIISALGGVALESIKNIFIPIIPLIILLPTLNDMVGDYATIMSSRFSTMLHKGVVQKKWWLNEELKNLCKQVFIISMLIALLSASFSLVFSKLSPGYKLTSEVALKVMAITVIDVAVLVSILIFTSIVMGLYFFRKKEDPNNFLIPITTSIADFGNMIMLSLLIVLLF